MQQMGNQNKPWIDRFDRWVADHVIPVLVLFTMAVAAGARYAYLSEMPILFWALAIGAGIGYWDIFKSFKRARRKEI